MSILVFTGNTTGELPIPSLINLNLRKGDQVIQSAQRDFPRIDTVFSPHEISGDPILAFKLEDQMELRNDPLLVPDSFV
jgi:hypothetical protein